MITFPPVGEIVPIGAASYSRSTTPVRVGAAYIRDKTSTRGEVLEEKGAMSDSSSLSRRERRNVPYSRYPALYSGRLIIWTRGTEPRDELRPISSGVYSLEAQRPLGGEFLQMSEVVSGAEFKRQLRAGKPKLGLFLNSHSPTVAEQLAHSGYDWLLVDTQHGPMGYETLSAMLAGISHGGAKSLVRVAGYHDRGGIQQSLDTGADGVLIPYINTADEARQAVSCCRYPTSGTRSVYFPQRSMNKQGLLGYAGAANDNVIVALQVETADCIKNIDEIAAVPGVNILFLGQNDLCMSMGLYEKYVFPEMYTSPELHEATEKLRAAAQRNNVILGLFLFGTARVAEFLKKDFSFISVGNDLHHILTQATAYVKDVEGIAKETGKDWSRRPTALM